MEGDRISARQLYGILFTGLLTPAVRALPVLTAAVADKSAWLTGLLAFPPLLAAGWAVYTLSRGQDGLSGGFRRAFGAAAGRAVTIIYMLWAIFLLCLEGRLYAGRMVTAGYRGASPAVFLLVLLVVVVWMARRKLSAFARAAEICFLVLALILALVVGFSLLDARPRRVLPVWTQDLPAAAAATLVPVGVLSGRALGGLLGGHVGHSRGGSPPGARGCPVRRRAGRLSGRTGGPQRGGRPARPPVAAGHLYRHYPAPAGRRGPAGGAAVRPGGGALL